MSSSRRRGPATRPRRPPVAGMRGRATQGLTGVSGSQHGVHQSDTDIDSAQAPVEETPQDRPPATAEDPEQAGESGESEARPVAESETVIAKAVIDGTHIADDPVEDSADQPVDDVLAETAEIPSALQDEVPDEEPTETTEAATETSEVAGASGRRRRIMAFAALGLTVVFGVLAFWFYSEVNALRNEGPAANHALSDPAATSEVNGQITNAVQQTFSYDFANTAKTENAAKSLLVGSAIQQYNDLYAIVKQLAPQQKLVLTTTVRASAVTQLQGNRAQVLVFVDQNDTRTDTGQSNSDTGQISIGAVKQGNQWKIDQIEQR